MTEPHNTHASADEPSSPVATPPGAAPPNENNVMPGDGSAVSATHGPNDEHHDDEHHDEHPGGHPHEPITEADGSESPVLEAIAVPRAAASEPGGMPPPQKPARARRDPLPLLFGIGIVILIGAVVYLWRHPISGLMANAAPDEHVVALQQQVAGLQQEISGLEQRPVPAPVNLAPLQQQLGTLAQHVDELEKRPAAGQAGDTGPAVDTTARDQVTALAAKIDSLTTKFDALTSKFDALTKQQTQIASSQSATTAALAARIDADQQRLAAVTAQAGQIVAVTGRLDAQDQRVGALATEAGKITGVAERAARVARIQAATAALEAGRPLGDLPDIPGPQGIALARFRTEAPPTEAALRLAFPDAAAAAQLASRPDTSHLPFWQAMQSRAEELVTVRRGDDVVVGDPAAGIIARARHALDAGDLAGTVAVLTELTGKPAAAFADWLKRANALLDARAALAAMAALAARA